METRIGRALTSGQVTEGSLVRVDVQGGRLAVCDRAPKGAEVLVAV